MSTKTKTVNGNGVLTYESSDFSIPPEVRRVCALLPRACDWVRYVTNSVDGGVVIGLAPEAASDPIEHPCPDGYVVEEVSMYNTGGVSVTVTPEER